MFTSNEWKSSKLAKANDCKIVEDVILDKDFWKNIITCLEGGVHYLELTCFDWLIWIKSQPYSSFMKQWIKLRKPKRSEELSQNE